MWRLGRHREVISASLLNKVDGRRRPRNRGADAAPRAGLNKVRTRYRNVGRFVAILNSRDRRDAISRSDLRDRHHRAAPPTRRVAFGKHFTICGLCSEGDGSEGEFRSGAVRVLSETADFVGAIGKTYPCASVGNCRETHRSPRDSVDETTSFEPRRLLQCSPFVGLHHTHDPHSIPHHRFER